MFRGQSKILQSALTVSPGVPLNLTGNSEIKLYVGRELLSPVSSIVLDIDLSVDGDPTAGNVIKTFVPGDTSSKTPGEYQAQIKVSYASGAIYFSPVFSFAILSPVKG